MVGTFIPFEVGGVMECRTMVVQLPVKEKVVGSSPTIPVFP